MSPSEKLRQFFDFRINLGTLSFVVAALVGFVVGYTRLQDEVNAMRQELLDHKAMQAAEVQLYVRKDVADTRDKFIDQQLTDIKETLSQILREIRAR